MFPLGFSVVRGWSKWAGSEERTGKESLKQAGLASRPYARSIGCLRLEMVDQTKGPELED